MNTEVIPSSAKIVINAHVEKKERCVQFEETKSKISVKDKLDKRLGGKYRGGRPMSQKKVSKKILCYKKLLRLDKHKNT